MIFLELYISFLIVGGLGFGGGYAILPLIQHLTVTQKAWLTATEFADLVTISQLTPGPIILNSATFVGSKLAGPLGGLVATAGIITPSIIITLILCKLYFRYRDLSIMQDTLTLLKPVVTGLIAVASLGILVNVIFTVQGNLDFIFMAMVAVAIIAYRKFKVGMVALIGGGGLIGLALYLLGIA